MAIIKVEICDELGRVVDTREIPCAAAQYVKLQNEMYEKNGVKRFARITGSSCSPSSSGLSGSGRLDSERPLPRLP